MIYRETLKHFSNTSLEKIELPGNNIEMIEEGALQYLPKTLKYLDLGANNINFGAYWRDLATLTNLEYINLGGLSMYQEPHKFPHSFPSKTFYCGNVSIDIDTRSRSSKDNKCVCGEEPPCKFHGMTLPLPVNL